MLDLATVTADIARWIETFVEVPHPALGGWAPCPYARQARLNQEYAVQSGHSIPYDLIGLSHAGLGTKKVIVLAYPADQYSPGEFSYLTGYINHLYLQAQDLIALPDHPADPEVVNGVAMNQGTYALLLIQARADLDHKARLIAQKGFYQGWPEAYLQELFRGRQDPRL